MTSVYDRVACMGTSFLAKQREGVAGEFNSEKKKSSGKDVLVSHTLKSLSLHPRSLQLALTNAPL